MKRKAISFLILFVFIFAAAGFGEEKWQEHSSSHFLIYYREAPIDFIKTVEENAEEYYSEITSNLGFTRYDSWTWDKRAKIYIYDDPEDYIRFSKQADWSHGAASVQEKIIRTFPSAHGFFDSTLPHELGHIIFREFVGLYADVPTWFDEGVAMYQEKAKRWGTNKIVKQAMAEGKFIPLNKLSTLRLTNKTERDTVDLFYAEAASIIYFLMTEFGQSRFVGFCRELKEGNPFEVALKSVYVRFDNIDKLNETWIQYLQR